MIRALLLALALLFAGPAHARETGFLDRELRLGGTTHRYQVYVPRDLRRGERPPIILALHGAGERGENGLLQTDVGLAHAIRQHPERWRAIVVFPQVPADRLWQDMLPLATGALAAAEREFRTDPTRVYLTGLSMGGNGAWKLAAEQPDRFAALVVVCGFVQPIPIRNYQPIVPAGNADPFAYVAGRIARVPTWIVHGDADSVVPVTDSRRMTAALTAAGAQVTYKELPGVNHNAWDPGYADAALPAWLFAQRRK